VGPDDTVTTRMVKVGERVADRWTIEQGLEPGARVVVEGGATRDGMAVSPKPYVPAAGGR
jgi:multidrug efflux pump subunit AcrA (membrane-fusion protein)